MVLNILLHIISVDPAPESPQGRRVQELDDADLIGAILTRPYALFLLAERERRDRERFGKFGRNVELWTQYMSALPGEVLMQLIAFSKLRVYREEWERRRGSAKPAPAEEAAPAPEFTNIEEVAQQAQQAAEDLSRRIEAGPRPQSFEDLVRRWEQLRDRESELDLAREDTNREYRAAMDARIDCERGINGVLRDRGQLILVGDLAFEATAHGFIRKPVVLGGTIPAPTPAPGGWSDAECRKG